MFCFVLFCFVLFCFVLFCFILFYFILFYFILFYFILFYFILIKTKFTELVFNSCLTQSPNRSVAISTMLYVGSKLNIVCVIGEDKPFASNMASPDLLYLYSGHFSRRKVSWTCR